MNFVVLLASLVAASNLVRVNDKNFADVVLKLDKFTLVDFYADWCRHCMHLMPIVEQVADKFASVPNVQVVKINGDDDGKKMTNKYNLEGFPTLLLFNGDQDPIEYEGMRDAEAIANFVQQLTEVRLDSNPKSKEEAPLFDGIVELNDANFEEVVLKAPHKTAVAFTLPWCKSCQLLHPVWLKLASLYRDDGIEFGVVDFRDSNRANVEQISSAFGIEYLPTVLFFDPANVDDDGLRRPVKFSGDPNLEFLVAFINDETGLSRDSSGLLLPTAGWIALVNEGIELLDRHNETAVGALFDHLDLLTKSAAEHERSHLVKLGVLFYKDDVSMLSYYRLVLAELAQGNIGHLRFEHQRLALLAQQPLKKATVDNLQKRANVLAKVLKHHK